MTAKGKKHYFGAHVSSEECVALAPINAKLIGAQSFALFTRNPSRWTSPELEERDIKAFKDNCEVFGFEPSVILPHDSYLINLGSPDKTKLAMSRKAFLDELQRCEQLGLEMLNFHPGAHLDTITEEQCLAQIALELNKALEKTHGVTAVIENTAGQGSNLGFTFEQIAQIIDQVEDKERVGVCIDSCHAFAAGYDLSTEEGYEAMWNKFDEVIGLKFLRAMHLNDSKKGLGSRVDRHESLGKGAIGSRFFELVASDPRLAGKPLILETPNYEIWDQEIEQLKSYAKTPECPHSGQQLQFGF